jgi:cytosine/adenosine deaminase-related metal-dependent hydrolase
VGYSTAIFYKYNITPTQYLHGLKILNKKTIAAHCVHLTQNDIKLLSQNNVGVAHNPECNMKLASGVAPLPNLLKRKIDVGLGTDGAALSMPSMDRMLKPSLSTENSSWTNLRNLLLRVYDHTFHRFL